MTTLVERYVYQVGRYLPEKERAEIETELRSQIQDQLDDRYGNAPTQTEIAAVLTELGEPRKMAASYGREQYLVGPDLYPYLMTTLRHGWVIVPVLVVFVTVFEALVTAQPSNVIALFIEAMLGALQAALIFTGVAVLIFAVLQQSGERLDLKPKPFDPLELPAVDDPGAVERSEAAWGIMLGTFVTLVMLYWLRVGGLTLRFNLNDPGEVIPVSMLWLVLLIVVSIAMVAVHLVALRRNRWSLGMWLAQTVLELIGAVGLYVVLYVPLHERLFIAAPALANVPFLDRAPELLTIGTVLIMLLTDGSKLIRLWGYQQRRTLSVVAL